MDKKCVKKIKYFIIYDYVIQKFDLLYLYNIFFCLYNNLFCLYENCSICTIVYYACTLEISIWLSIVNKVYCCFYNAFVDNCTIVYW
jgi:hypothetical protein